MFGPGNIYNSLLVDQSNNLILTVVLYPRMFQRYLFDALEFLLASVKVDELTRQYTIKLSPFVDIFEFVLLLQLPRVSHVLLHL